jgi:hypothetical protein
MQNTEGLVHSQNFAPHGVPTRRLGSTIAARCTTCGTTGLELDSPSVAEYLAKVRMTSEENLDHHGFTERFPTDDMLVK